MGAVAGVGSCTCGGLALVCVRYLNSELDPLSVAVWRHLGPGLVVLALVAPLARRLEWPSRADWPALIGLALLQYAAFGYFVSLSLASIPAARGALIMATMPLVTLTIGALLGREAFTRLKVIGGLIALAGLVVAIGDRAGGASSWVGDLSMVAATVIGSLYAVMSSIYIRRYAAVVVTAIVMPIGGVALFIAALSQGVAGGLLNLSAWGWFAAIVLTIVGGVVAHFLWNWALSRTTPSRVAITITFNPIAASLAGVWTLGEPVGLSLVLGLALVIAGMVIAYWPASR